MLGEVASALSFIPANLHICHCCLVTTYLHIQEMESSAVSALIRGINSRGGSKTRPRNPHQKSRLTQRSRPAVKVLTSRGTACRARAAHTRNLATHPDSVRPGTHDEVLYLVVGLPLQ